jgi:hypothetical protein
MHELVNGERMEEFNNNKEGATFVCCSPAWELARG